MKTPRWIFRRIAVLAFWIPGALAVRAEPVPVPLGEAANRAFADEREDDQQGGWTDQGAHDLRVLEPGRLEVSGIPFVIRSDVETGGRSCIVLGGGARPTLAQQAELPVKAGGDGEALYLLHAGAWTPWQGQQGTLTLTYAGRRGEPGFSIRPGLLVRCRRARGRWG